ncbi:uncharacterized protein LOC105183323 isoform X1 [Harpegnathos saltator]|uniref:uncharacterized protein LOC105183323 isoform X1 n=1 Tax=Harpegnathos saltator TaxID=610380 RepID=UPI000DBEEC06|nr:uncharacterized protein LOC105183323 isoform X1 [Harpegnathos saltator]XP_019697021.2 uncharacterized protein LOC105183323 isoform X1 [Harpegnathos saltator]XP_019697023.2 uncharacterized protein LOC105183323 isoform X1 [Harpegnathos saltator]XP_025160153.1 uncharacterized protein LOC105183323 isoform X1 [Harpegnathos saltator]
MICVELLHIDLNRLLLLAVGLWPYQQSKLVQLQLILLFSILTTFILSQLTSIVTSEYTSELLINVSSTTLFYITFVIKYSSFRVNIETMRHLLELLQRIYNELRDENEINIMRKYGQLSKRYTAAIMIIATCTTTSIIAYLFCPLILDIMRPLNETRPQPSLEFEYFVNQKKYFYLILLHAITAFIVGGLAMISTGAILIAFLQHACGMFRISSYRIEHAMAIGTVQSGNVGNNNRMYKGLIYAIDIHRKAMQFSDMSISKFKVSFFLLIIAGVICGSLNLFRIFQTMTAVHSNVGMLLIPLAFIVIHLMYMIIGNYVAQEIMDHNNHVFATIYDVRWYVAPLNIQKMILFLLQRSTKVFTLNIGGVIVGSLENAATVRKIVLKIFSASSDGLIETRNACRRRWSAPRYLTSPFFTLRGTNARSSTKWDER